MPRCCQGGWRPGFPVSSNYYPTGLPIALSPFSVPTLERFIQYELPEDEERQAVCEELKIRPAAGAAPYSSVSQLYTVIRETPLSFARRSIVKLR